MTQTYDAFTVNRGYRAAHPPKKALTIMKQEHNCFDPQLLEIFFNMQGRQKQ